MHTLRYLLIAFTVCCGFAAAVSSCKSDDDPAAPSATTAVVRTVNVDIILPADKRQQWQNSIDWAMANIEKAQQKESRRVRLNLRYHDEDTENLEALGARLTLPREGDDTCHAIIGPFHSYNAPTLLKYAATDRLPVIMPTCTSAELQRIYARSTFAWFLTESDVTQCEIMLSAAHAVGATDVALVYSDDSYGLSFRDWFGYYATEDGFNVAGSGLTTFSRGTDLTPFLQEAARDAANGCVLLLVALSDATLYNEVCRQCKQFNDSYAASTGVYIATIGADTSDTSLITDDNKLSPFYLGITPVGSMNHGFPQAYQGNFSRRPVNGEAQVYDALTLIALGAAKQWTSPDRCIVNGSQVVYKERPYTVGLTDYMRSVVSSWNGKTTNWDDNGLATAFHETMAGRDIDLTGATGDLIFDGQTSTKILQTTYMLWMLEQKEPLSQSDGYFSYLRPVTYLSTNGTSGAASTTNLWEMEKRYEQTFADEGSASTLPELKDRWALVISPSTTWANYRHQADAFAMYQLLRSSGYDDDHIVLIVEDNLHDNANNKFPGQIFVERFASEADNYDVRRDAVVDYHFSDLQPADLADIMTGRSSDRLPQVLHTTDASNVFFFWSGHGGSREGPLWGNEDADQYFGTQRITDIVSQMAQRGQYRRMMFALESCYSGCWGEALSGQPNVLLITAANSHETSDADMHDKTLGVFLSNAFARTFRDVISDDSEITIYNLYKQLARTTVGSHVTLYNQLFYGSVYTETMAEYFQ